MLTAYENEVMKGFTLEGVDGVVGLLGFEGVVGAAGAVVFWFAKNTKRPTMTTIITTGIQLFVFAKVDTSVSHYCFLLDVLRLRVQRCFSHTID